MARHYDALMSHVRYDLWADYIRGMFDRAQTPVSDVLDMACGTGSLAYALARAGFDVIGVDRSADMLARAEAKRPDVSPSDSGGPMFLRQKLWELDLFGTVDAAVCTMDSINFILRTEQLRNTFERARTFLNPGGVLVFDVRTPYHFEKTDGRAQIAETTSCFCAWTPRYNARTGICAMELDLFERDGRVWRRYAEVHRQRCYTMDRLTRCLLDAGFADVEQFHPFERTPPKPAADRVFFRAVK
jgi:SAM-dependent methyltransferase